ncbi:MAG TPA: ABC transporter ATP-binding protein [Chlamydiales bacterium]|jgi:ATP-binding cassette subfamily B protein/subfamily B ATP-binding cassette protein MsbA
MLAWIKRWASTKLWKLFIGEKGKNLWIFSFLVFLSFTAALLEGISFSFLLTAFSGLQATPASHPNFLQRVLLTQSQGIQLFFLSTSFAIFFQILRSAMCYVGTVFSMNFAFKIQTRVQSEIYNQILRLSYGCISRLKIGELLENARAPVHLVCPLLEAVNRFVASVLTALVIVGMMFFLDFRLALVTLCLFGLFSFLQKSIIKTILKFSDSLSKHLAEVNQDASQMLQGIKVIQIFSQQERIKKKAKNKINDIGVSSKKVYLFSSVIPYLNEMISVLVLGVILIVATSLKGAESDSFLAVLMTFLIISYRLSTRVQNALVILGTASAYYGPLLRINDILEEKNKEFLPVGGTHLDEPIHELSIEGVSFRYQMESEAVLKNFSFSFQKGATIGIVGLSGSGKTSLLDLLLRLYEPTRGAILANKTNIQAFSLDSWRAKFGVVGQESFLFDESIEENIRFGLDKISIDNIVEAAKTVGIDDLIQRLPQKYQTVVGERGLRLSGGERQRIVLARALLRDPEILILDEATSNLDSESETCIQNALEKLQKRKTLIVIAHRLSTIAHSDQILVMERGVLIESGTHEMLLKNKGRYSTLWELQTKNQPESNAIFANIQ